MKMKKFLSLALALGMTVSLGACGNKETQEDTNSAKPSGDKPYVAIVSKGFQHQFWQVVKKGAEQAAKDYNASITFDGPPTESDIAIQVDMLKSAMDKKPDAVCLAALDTEAVKEQLNDLKTKKIPVVGFDSGVPGAPEGSIFATASTDNAAAAAIAADQLYKNEDFAKKLKAATAKAPIKIGVLSQDATSESIVSRTSGFIDKLVELVGKDKVEVTGHDKYAKKATDPIVKILVNVPATTSATDQKSGAETLLGQGLAAIYGSNENSAGGILSASNDGNDFNKENGKFKDITAIGFDAGKTQRTAVQNGWFLGSVTQDPYQIGYKSVELAVKAIKGEKVSETVVDTGAKWYNKDNLSDAKISELVYE